MCTIDNHVCDKEFIPTELYNESYNENYNETYDELYDEKTKSLIMSLLENLSELCGLCGFSEDVSMFEEQIMRRVNNCRLNGEKVNGRIDIQELNYEIIWNVLLGSRFTKNEPNGYSEGFRMVCGCWQYSIWFDEKNYELRRAGDCQRCTCANNGTTKFAESGENIDTRTEIEMYVNSSGFYCERVVYGDYITDTCRISKDPASPKMTFKSCYNLMEIFSVLVPIRAAVDYMVNHEYFDQV